MYGERKRDYIGWQTLTTKTDGDTRRFIIESAKSSESREMRVDLSDVDVGDKSSLSDDEDDSGGGGGFPTLLLVVAVLAFLLNRTSGTRKQQPPMV